MGRLRSRSGITALAVVGTIVVVGGGAVLARTVMEDQAEAKVRDLAVGTWKCDEHFEGELQSVYFMGITSDGRIGSAEEQYPNDEPVGSGKEPAKLVEFGTWTVDGLTVELRFPMMFAGEGGSGFEQEAMLTYEGDADPPKEILVTDHLAGEDTPARWTADIADDEAHFDEIERASGDAGVMDYDCVRRSTDEPELVKER